MCDYPNHVTLIAGRKRTRVLFKGPAVTHGSDGTYQNVSSTVDVGNKSVLVPCGSCEKCVKARVTEWRNRLVLESKLYEHNYFVTYTYEDVHHPVDGLNKRHVQLLFKRMRKAGLNFRYFCKGEYGPNTGRAHYHILFFGLKLDDLFPWKTSARKQQLYISPFLSSFWPYGFVVVGKVSEQSAYYVASYGTKNSKDEEWYGWTRNDNALHVQQPEFFLFSKSLGYRNIMSYYCDETQRVYFEGNSFSLPRWYRRKHFILERPKVVSRTTDDYKNSISLTKSKQKCLTKDTF